MGGAAPTGEATLPVEPVNGEVPSEAQPAPIPVKRIKKLKANLSNPTGAKVLHPFQGIVGSQEGFTTFCVMSPNQDYIPEYPVERQVIKTYTDGRWGVHEYSRWPQLLVDGMWHIACIPRCEWGEELGLSDMLWRTISPSDWKEDPTAVIAELGYLDKSLVDELTKAAEQTIQDYQHLTGVPPHRLEYGLQLVIVLGQCIDRMRLLASGPAIAVAVAAHVQRLSLELQGLLTYLQVVLARIDSHQDRRLDVLPVLGTFVKEGTAASTCVRIGLPVFFLQPLTQQVRVCRVVSVKRVADELSATTGNPPILHRPGEFAGVMNLTRNWTTDMVVRISRDLCSSSLPDMMTLPSAEPSERPREGKRPRVESTKMPSKTIEMPVVARPARKGKAPTGTKKTVASGSGTVGAAGAGPTGKEHHPSRHYVRSPFVALPNVWFLALLAAGHLPQPPCPLVFFYPPPFLLDTVSTQAPAPEGCEARQDDKIAQYLYNLVHIRSFCRLRLFDSTRDGRPLSIAEWRVALFGDYAQKMAPVVTTSITDKKRSKRRYDKKNAVARLFGQDGSLRTYRDQDVLLLGDIEVTKGVAASDLRVRGLLLWESHEINFRCELVALDRAVLPRVGWTAFAQWQREAVISRVWGSGSGVLSVLPEVPGDHERFSWRSCADPAWRESLDALRAFLIVMDHWPGFPDVLKDMPRKAEDWTEEHFERAQGEAVQFYTQTFVRVFHCLPTPPYQYTTEL